MKATILAINTPDWAKLDEFIGKATNLQPIRFLDEKRINPGGLYAFLVSLELFFDNQNSKNFDRSLDHVYLSLGIQGEYGDMDIFIDIAGSKAYRIVRGKKTDLTFIYMTASLKEWRNLVIDNSREHLPIEKRFVFNLVFEELKRLNLAELFSAFSPTPMPDGTFYLELD